jgi:alkanesulfonate monooxygenase SsuD/methylene tetrahydromethanopterin reductase-like flavin-dependent oxidoreductase (luciferase family)
LSPPERLASAEKSPGRSQLRAKGVRVRQAGVNVFAADTDREAQRLFTSAQQQFTNLVRGTPGKLPPPIDEIDAYWTTVEKAKASTMLSYSFVGSFETVAAGLRQFIEQTEVDEVIVVSAIYDHGARLRSYEILSGLFPRAH